MSRRSFIKASTVAGAALALSTKLAGSLAQTDEAWAVTPGETKMYVTTCHGCIQVCPARVYVENNVAVKIEGHPIGPANLGSMCLKGLAQLHTMYSPLRVLYPLKRAGDRGAENVKWERISWDEALDLASSKIMESAEKYGTYSFFTSTGGGGGYSFEQTRTLVTALGSPNVIEPGCAQCYLPRVAIADLMYAGQNQSIADSSFQEFHKGLSPYEAAKGVSQDTVSLVVWGAQPSVSQTAQSGRGIADLREAGCKIVVVDPNQSPDAVKADVWLRVRPGSDGALILSWYRYIFENKLYDADFCKKWTNLPFIINPDTHLPYLAQEIFPDFVQTTPENTPAYVCWDNLSGSLMPFEYAATDVDPEIFWSGDVNGKKSRSAGQVYKDAADPWTLEKTEEMCWIPADVIEKGIRIYTDAPVAGIAHGVATDMMQDASQVPLGLIGLDMIMGYVNKKGAALTQHYRPPFVDGDWAVPPPGPQARPVLRVNGSFGTLYELGYYVGESEQFNQAIQDGLPESDGPRSKDRETLNLMNQLFLDRLGMKNHKGLYHWMHSHIPSVLEAIVTGIPYKPRVWFDFSGNKLAVIGDAGAWYRAFPEIDFCMCQYPMITSFQAEVGDLIFPLEEWLENAIVQRWQLNYAFPQLPILHLGETVNSMVPPVKVQNATSKKFNDYLAAGNKLVFGATGAVVGAAPASPSDAGDGSTKTSINATYVHDNSIIADIPLHFPIGLGVQGTVEEDSVVNKQLVDRYLAPDFDTLMNDVSYQQPDPLNPVDPRFVLDPKIFWQYDQHLAEARDGLPRGFGTESRKCEVYCSILIKMAANGFPYCYPREQEAVDPSIGTEVLAHDPSYPFVGTYSPICWHVEPAESPIEGMPGYDPEYPLVLTSGRVYYWHHGTQRHSPFIRELLPVPDVRIHPRTAEKYGLKHMDWVEITSRRGSTKGRVFYTASMDERVIFMERFWNPECYDNAQPKKTGGWQECNVNVLTKASAPYNEVFGSYTNRGFTVKIEKSTKPDNIWTQPKEFEPFLPSNPNQLLSDIGSALDMEQTPPVKFNDWEGGA